MERIYFNIQSAKKEGQITLHYRLVDGRKVQLTYKSDIKCDVQDIAKFEPDGKPKKRVSVYNEDLKKRLEDEYRLIMQAYSSMRDEGKDLTSSVLRETMAKLKSPVIAIRSETPNIVTRFRAYADNALRDGTIGKNRHKHILVVSDKLERFLIINGISGLTAEEFDNESLMEFRAFLFDEYLYVKKYPKLYEKVNSHNKPKERLSMNTVTSQLKMFQTFFNELEMLDEIRRSPFKRMSKEKRKSIMRTKYDDPIYLRREELLTILDTEVPPYLQDTRDAFLVQCALGPRIGDFVKMGLFSISISPDGIPYVHYLPNKTIDFEEGNSEVLTPIVRFAFEIIKRTRFEFPILKNVYGKYGYNNSIKALLQYCKIDRTVPIYNEATKDNDHFPLYSVASNKLARKTHVDILTKIQINPYVSGLHKEGSSAVNRYTKLSLSDLFSLMNLAFEQDDFRVDAKLNIIN